MVRVLLLTLISFSAFSQDIKFDNIGVSGGDFNNNNTRVSFTVGQPIIGTSANNSNIVTQGFQQGNTVFYNPSNPPNNPNVILGCTDSLALNYNPLANVDDSTCCGAEVSIPFGVQIGQDITGFGIGDQFGYNVSINSDGTIIAVGSPDESTSNGLNSGGGSLVSNIV